MTINLRDILEKVDPDELIDILGLTTADLVDRLDDLIHENIDKFQHLDRGDEWYD